MDGGCAQLENVSEEILSIKKALVKAQEERSNWSEEGTPSPQLLLPDQTDSTILQFINEKRWASALKFIKHNRLDTGIVYLMGEMEYVNDAVTFLQDYLAE